MPLVRVEVRNEYGLGMPELYTETDREDPKAVLDGVAVAGLVGILRQLGDLAEFAAEVFHGLQEQVLITSSRSHKLVERVHNIEAALPPLEKAILAQRSHLHFAYTAGSHWHTRIRTEQNHFIYGDLPRCIMDSYEDCRDPPRLHKLDKFDIAGPGACFRRYSDPTYFKRTSVGPYEAHLQSVPREKKARRNKKKRSSSRYRDVTRGAPVIMPAGITDFGSSNFEEKSSPVSQDVSTFHVPQKPEIEPEIDHLTSFDSRNGSGYIECIFRPSYSTQSEDNIAKEPSSDSNPQYNSHLDSDENIQNSSSKSKSKSTYITWDEKLEIIDSTSQPNDTTEIACETEKIDTEENEDMNLTIVDQVDFDFHGQQPESTLVNVGGHHDEIESETDYYMDALNTIESESETDPDCHTKRELIKCNNVNKNDLDDSSANFEFHVPVPEHAELATSPHVAEISEISPISLNTPENFKSEEAQRHVTNESIPSEPILTTRESPEPFLSTSAGQSQSQSQTTVSNPVMFWTNGGLLGLEPSKPPDFGLPTTVVEETKAENTSNENTGVNSSISESSGTLTPGGAESAPKDDHDPITSSQIFEFSNRLLVNGFRKQVSLVGNEKLASSVKTEIPEKTSLQNGYKTVTGIPFREQFGNIIKNENNKPLISPSSPPLEHMKISFQPIDGFEINKLKLTFPDENNNMFPSFQLVPECSISLHESGSDSDDDDDTFCRSSPYASDDLNSNQSESNSENWDSTRTKDHELDDAFGRISSAESVSSSNRIKFQQNDGLFDIPNFDPVNDIADPTPPPPPLPPVEWRGVKPPHDVTNEKEDDLSEALTFALNLTPQQPKPAPRKQEYVVEKDDLTLNLKQNLHVHNESNRAINGKMEGEKEDFLQQIRTKSLNLRRTSTSRVTTTPVGPTSVKVTAILEKASAIRQAVGSDDGEDDTWSDT